ncbi:MAG: M20/M25/M40 family metallo-hydrolase [Balneolaceae bacterium]|nr:M20/M25/M40 family metallo-hydrolase [Balneolaceae bacterium]
MDTVFPIETDVTVEQSGDTLFAPGIGDDGRGLTTVLALLRSIDTLNLSFESDILFIGNVGEEGLGDLRGMKYLFREGGPQIDFFISVDGTRIKSITNGALGSHRYEVTFKGPGGHSWGAFGLANPHHALSRAITHFVDKAEEYTQTDPKTSYNIGRIGGGTSVNSIPFESWLEVDMRSLQSSDATRIDT